MTLIAKACDVYNLCDTKVAMEQKPFGFLQSRPQSILMGCYTHLLLEQTQKMIGADLGDRNPQFSPS
jgi:hypothetical protein